MPIRKTITLSFSHLTLSIMLLGSFSGKCQTDVDSIKIRVLFDSIEMYSTNYDRSISFARKALKMSRKIQSNELIGQSYYMMSDINYNHSRFNVAIDQLDKAREYYRKDRFYDMVAFLTADKGRIYYEMGDLSSASELYFEALSIIKKHDLKSSRKAWILRYQGSVYRQQGKYKIAREYYEEAFKEFELYDDYTGMCSSLNTIGLSYMASRKNDSLALSYFLRALAVAREHGLIERITLIYGNIGDVYKNWGDYDKAMINYEFKLNYYLEKYSYMEYEISECRLNISELEVYRGNFKKAEELLDMINTNSDFGAENIKNEVLSNYYNVRSLLNKKKENFQLAMFYDNLSDSLVLLKNKEILSAEIDKVKFSYDRIEIENKAKQEKLVLEERTANQRMWITLLSIGVMCFFVLGVIIYFQKRRLSRTYKNLVRHNVRIAEKQMQALHGADEPLDSPPDDDTTLYAGSALDENQKRQLVEDVLDLVESKKLYLDSNVSVQLIADNLDTNKSYVSQVINEKLKVNFSSFINEYRINEVILAFRNNDSSKLTIEGIAKSVGFRSISAFNISFKKQTGMTPSKFLKSLKNRQ